LPNGRSRHPTANVPGDLAAYRRTAAAAATSASVRRSMVVRSRPTNRRSASIVRKNRQMRPSNAARTVWDAEAIDSSHLGFRPIQKIATIHASSGFIRGIPIKMSRLFQKIRGRARRAAADYLRKRSFVHTDEFTRPYIIETKVVGEEFLF